MQLYLLFVPIIITDHQQICSCSKPTNSATCCLFKMFKQNCWRWNTQIVDRFRSFPSNYSLWRLSSWTDWNIISSTRMCFRNISTNKCLFRLANEKVSPFNFVCRDRNFAKLSKLEICRNLRTADLWYGVFFFIIIIL